MIEESSIAQQVSSNGTMNSSFYERLLFSMEKLERSIDSLRDEIADLKNDHCILKTQHEALLNETKNLAKETRSHHDDILTIKTYANSKAKSMQFFSHHGYKILITAMAVGVILDKVGLFKLLH